MTKKTKEEIVCEEIDRLAYSGTISQEKIEQIKEWINDVGVDTLLTVASHVERMLKNYSFMNGENP